MSNSENVNTTSPIATQPIINIINPIGSEDISWEVKDGEPIDLPFQEEIKKEEVVEPEKIENEQEAGEEPQAEDIEAKEPEDETLEKEKKKPLRAPKDRRIAELTRKNKQYEAVLSDTLKQKEYLERQLSQKAQEKIVAEENLLKNHLENIEKAHADALEEGDYEKAAKAANLMAQYAARHETIAQQKYQLSIPAPQNPPPENQPPRLYEQSEEFQTNGKDWIENNTWADQNSNNFDEEMLGEAENYVNLLMKQYKFEGRAHDIGKPEFFNRITQHVREVFDIAPPSKPIKEKLVMNANTTSNVAPVNRTGTMSNVARGKQEIVLSPEQVKMAHSMSGIKLNGQRITDRKQLENLYRDNLRNQMKRG